MKSTPNKEGQDSGPIAPPGWVEEVRYSLPELLAEVKLERTAAVFAMEKLEQLEIRKIFKTRSKSHGKPH
jgi:hypothetical protein